MFAELMGLNAVEAAATDRWIKDVFIPLIILLPFIMFALVAVVAWAADVYVLLRRLGQWMWSARHVRRRSRCQQG